MRSRFDGRDDADDMTPGNGGGLVHKSMVEVVTDAVTADIQTGRIEPGERIMPGLLAKRLNVSQTPIREAMRTLEMQGLIVVDRRATFARPLSIESIREVYKLRRLIECEAARNCISNQTPEDVRHAERAWVELQRHADDPYSESFWQSHREFHWSIYRPSSEFDWTRRILEMLWREVERHVTISIKNLGEFSSFEHFEDVTDEHAEMWRCFLAKDKKGLVAVVKQHLERTEGTVEESVWENQSRE